MPYFRHKTKCECDTYSEPETEEHLLGKKRLCEWIAKQEGVSDVLLEGWIPETKQRPDIMFKYNNQQHVIEYQCTPISTEYFERKNLYKEANVICHWVLGVRKYLDCFSKDGKKNRMKEIEHDNNNIYYDPYTDMMISRESNFVCDVGKVAFSDVVSESVKCAEAWGVAEFIDKELMDMCLLECVKFDSGFVISEDGVSRCKSVDRRLAELLREANRGIAESLRCNGAWKGVDWGCNLIDAPTPTGGSYGFSIVCHTPSSKNNKVYKRMCVALYPIFINKKPMWKLIFSVGMYQHEILFRDHATMMGYTNKYLPSKMKWLIRRCVENNYPSKKAITKESI